MNSTKKTAIELQKQVSLLKATACKTAFVRLPNGPRQIFQAQYDARARHNTQTMGKTASMMDRCLDRLELLTQQRVAG